MTRKKTIEYIGRDGSDDTKWPENINNPMAPNFVPLTERGERAKSRWWALHARKSMNRQTHGEF